MADKKLIITDNKAMADGIARIIGYDPKDSSLFHYQGESIEVMWTGGDFLCLILKDGITEVPNFADLSAEKIARQFYNVYPRLEGRQTSVVDEARIRYIENAEKRCDEIVFMCQPTAEGERLIQAMKLFFNFTIPTRTVVLDNISEKTFQDDVCNGNSSALLSALRSCNAMRENVTVDVDKRNTKYINYERVSPAALKILQTICRRYKLSMEGQTNSKGRTRIVYGGMLDTNRLYAAMNIKYDMIMEQVWDSLVYLYAEGLISNPMNRLRHRPYSNEVYYGQGFSDDIHESPCDSFTEAGAIVPTGKIREELLNLPYDQENAPDDFFPRTSVIYTFIVEQKLRHDNNEAYESKIFPSFEEEPGLTLTSVISGVRYDNIYMGFSIRGSLGVLIEDLSCAALLNIRYGYLSPTKEGIAVANGDTP